MNFKKILLLSFILLCGCNQVNKNEKSFNLLSTDIATQVLL